MPAAPVPVNATAAAVLGLLHGGPMTGSELVASARGRFGTFFSVTRSQVYRELPALAASGLLALGEVGPRASQRYRITAAGKRAFRAWLAGPGGVDALRSPLVLRLLHADRLPDEERSALVEASRAAYAEQLTEASTAAEAEKDPYARAVAEFVVAHIRAMLALLDRVPA